MSNDQVDEDEDGSLCVCVSVKIKKEDGSPAAGVKVTARSSRQYGDVKEIADEKGEVTLVIHGDKGNECSRFEGGRYELRVELHFGDRMSFLVEGDWLGDGDGLEMTISDDYL